MVKSIAPLLAILLLAGCITGLLLSQYKGLFSVLLAVSMVALFFFPIRYDDRATVAKKAQQGMSFWSSPFPYMLILSLILAIVLSF